MKYKIKTKIIRTTTTEQIEELSEKPNMDTAVSRAIALMPMRDSVAIQTEVDGKWIVITEMGNKFVIEFEEL